MADLEKTIAPSLTLDPFAEPEPAPAPVAAAEEKPAEPVIVLSEEEQRMVDEFVPKIEIRDSGMITQYGAGAQKKIADFSEDMLDRKSVV